MLGDRGLCSAGLFRQAAYITNKMRERGDPWGSPAVNVTGFSPFPSNAMKMVLAVLQLAMHPLSSLGNREWTTRYISWVWETQLKARWMLFPSVPDVARAIGKSSCGALTLLPSSH